MAKVLHCRDVGMDYDCGYTARGDSEQEVMRSESEHARSEHDTDTMTPEMSSRAREAIHDESDDCPGCCS
ncbi:MAG: DUF1059 domain-containing protein [Anaerolineae bacterium]